MTIYYDSSTLLKIYINEEHSEFIRTSISSHQLNYISTLSYAEVHSVFSRLFNNDYISEDELKFIKVSFNNDFSIFQRIPIQNEILIRAAELSYITNLRALDSIHLASIEYLKSISNDDLMFACFDKKLSDAAISLGITLLKQ